MSLAFLVFRLIWFPLDLGLMPTYPGVVISMGDPHVWGSHLYFLCSSISLISFNFMVWPTYRLVGKQLGHPLHGMSSVLIGLVSVWGLVGDWGLSSVWLTLM